MKGTERRYTTSSVDDIPLQARRLDSIAWLIQGDDTCGAACFDGENLLLATNKNMPSAIVTATVDYLCYVADKSKQLKKDIDKGREINDRKFKEKIERHSEILMKAIAESQMHKDELRFRNDTEAALKKITDSIIASYIEPEGEKAIDSAIRHAIRKGKIEFVPGDRDRNGKSIHAEMKLVQKLLEKRKSDPDAVNNFYIGVSKKCCLKCDTVIQSINKVITPVRSDAFIIVRDSQQGVYPAGMPKFFVDDTLGADDKEKLKNAFLDSMKKSTGYQMNLGRAFECSEENTDGQQHRRSTSPAEKFGTLRRVMSDQEHNKPTSSRDVTTTTSSMRNNMSMNTSDRNNQNLGDSFYSSSNSNTTSAYNLSSSSELVGKMQNITQSSSSRPSNRKRYRNEGAETRDVFHSTADHSNKELSTDMSTTSPNYTPRVYDNTVSSRGSEHKSKNKRR